MACLLALALVLASAAEAGVEDCGLAEWIVNGNCTVCGDCVMSANYPEDYPNDANCTLTTLKAGEVENKDFETESEYDELSFDGQTFSGHFQPKYFGWAEEGTVIHWTSDESDTDSGWKLCLGPRPPTTTTTTRTTMTSTTATTTTTPCNKRSLWHVTGDCYACGSCVTSTNYPQTYPTEDHCVLTTLESGQSEVIAFHTDTWGKGDVLTMHLSREESFHFEGRLEIPTLGYFKKGQNLTWLADGYEDDDGLGWEICLNTSAPEPNYSIWEVFGKCQVLDNCVTSPNFPEEYDNEERCVIHPQTDGILNATSFLTESCCDHLEVGRSMIFDGENAPRNVYLLRSDTITWTTDGSGTGAGWQICLQPETTLPLLRAMGGDCEIEDNCIQSKDYPKEYSMAESPCKVEIRGGGIADTTHFSTWQSAAGLSAKHLAGKCLKVEDGSKTSMVDCEESYSFAFFFSEGRQLKTLDSSKDCLTSPAEAGGAPTMEDCGQEGQNWTFDGDSLKASSGLCLTAWDLSKEGPGRRRRRTVRRATMENCDLRSSRQQWHFVNAEALGDTLSIGDAKFSGQHGPEGTELEAGTMLTFTTGRRRRSEVPASYDGMAKPGWKVCLAPRPVIPAFLLGVVAAQAMVWALLYLCHRSWLKFTEALSAGWSRRNQGDSVQAALLDLFMPGGSSTNYQFKGMQKKSKTVSLQFEELGLKLMNGRSVLQGVSGSFQAGRMVAIMGPSGAGKTTFMNVLCGKATYGNMTGQVRVNDHECDVREISSVMGFVPQDDVVHAGLTVRENLSFAALLRNPPGTSQERTTAIVEDVLNVMQMGHIQRSIVGGVEERGISGGQRKRVNIGLELVACPTLLFLDEPTSGLDATSSLSIVNSLKKMTQLGMTIIMVIHQPRYSLFTLFDDVLLLGVGGKTVYLGPSSSAADYFEGLGFQMPPRDNPADWFMDVISGEIGNPKIKDFKLNILFDLWVQEKDKVKPSAPREITDEDTKAMLMKEVEDRWYTFDNNHSETLDELELKRLFSSVDGGEGMSEEVLQELMNRMGTRMQGTDKHVTKLDFMEFVSSLVDITAMRTVDLEKKESLASVLLLGGEEAASEPLLDSADSADAGPLEGLKRSRRSFCIQFLVIVARRLVQLFRQMRRRAIDCFLIVACACIVGSMDRGSLNVTGTDLPQALMICHMGLSLLTTVSSVRVFSADRPVFWRESASGTNVAAFYLGRVTVDTFDIVLQACIFSITYYLVGAPSHPSMSFNVYFWPFLLVSLTSSGWGYLISTLVPPENAVLGAVIFALIFCGIFGNPSNMGNLISGMVGDLVTFFSITRWSVQMTLCRTLQHANKIKMEVDSPLLVLGQDYERGIYLGHGWQLSVRVMVFQSVILRVFGYLGLKYTNRDKQV